MKQPYKLKDGTIPKVGKIKRGSHIGKGGFMEYVWQACSVCGKEQWVSVQKGQPISVKCKACDIQRLIALNKSRKGMTTPRLGRGGRIRTTKGYIEIKLHPSDPYFPMANKTRYVMEHRLIMAKHLGRCLLKSEQVHHINGFKDDNRLENLQLVSSADHSIYNAMCHACSLRKEIRLLRFQILELTKHLQGELFNEKRDYSSV